MSICDDWTVQETIAIEGLICSGKSTLCNALEGVSPDVKAVYETVIPSFRDAFYANPARYAFAFQTFMASTRIAAIELARYQYASKRLIVHDRNVLGDMVFETVQYRNCTISGSEHAIYRDIVQQCTSQPDRIVFLNILPTECRRRIIEERQVSSEMAIPLSYLEELYTAYAQQLYHWADRCPVHVIQPPFSSDRLAQDIWLHRFPPRLTTQNIITSYDDAVQWLSPPS